MSTPAADKISVPANLTEDPSLPVMCMYMESAASCLSTLIVYVVLPPLLIFKSDISIVCINVVPIPLTPIAEVLLPEPVI